MTASFKSMGYLIGKYYSVLALLIASAVFIGLKFTPYMGIATFSYSLMICGLLLKKQRTEHVPLMLTAIITDVLLVLVLELQRQAINTAVSMSLTGPQQAHIITSTLATVFYFPTTYFGFQILKGKTSDLKLKTKHIRFAITAFVLRSVGFILMFSLITHVKK